MEVADAMIWKVMNEYARNNVFFESAKNFRESIFGFFTDTIPKIRDTLDSRINDNFHIITTTANSS